MIIKPDGPNTLLLDKHADYIAAYGSKTDYYVSTTLHLYYMHVRSCIYYLSTIYHMHMLALFTVNLNRFSCSLVTLIVLRNHVCEGVHAVRVSEDEWHLLGPDCDGPDGTASKDGSGGHHRLYHSLST